MKVSIRAFTTLLFLLLAVTTVGLWTFNLHLQYHQGQTRNYVQQIETWQAQVNAAQAQQLMWLQSKFYDLRSGLLARPTPTQRNQYIDTYQTNVAELKSVWLIDRIERGGTQTDCEVLAQSLYAETEKGDPPLFFSCQHQGQAMMGVRGDFRIFGADTGLVILLDYFGFMPEFERLSGLALVRTAGLNGQQQFRHPDDLGDGVAPWHEITFRRDQVVLGSLRLQVANQPFKAYWLNRALWLVPVLALLLVVYLLLLRALIIPLRSLVAHMQPVITAHRPGQANHNNRLTPGLALLQRYFVQLVFMARNDPLTGLHNRVIFEERVQQALVEGRRSARRYALVLIDINGFHHVNRDAGHFIGDGILRELGKRLSGGLRESDTLARLEEDNFALLLEYADDGQLVSLLDKIHQSLGQTYHVYDNSIQVGISIGVATYPDQAQDMETLMLKADHAMVRSQQQNGGVVLSEETMDTADYSKLSHLQTFRQALDRNEFKLVFQPVVSLASHQTGYFEALLRWKKPGADQLSIPQIIELAENSNSIRDLSHWIIDSACAELQQLGRDDVKIAINLSMLDFHDESLPSYLQETVANCGIRPEQLMIEITEGQIMQNQGQVVGNLNQLAALGFSLSIDDFGTGQASLTYLRNLPVEKIKIDQSFVRELVANRDDRSIVEATIQLAHTLGLEVVAEGVESIEIHDLLQGMNCDYVQGYYISKPMESEQVLRWCESHCPA